MKVFRTKRGLVWHLLNEEQYGADACGVSSLDLVVVIDGPVTCKACIKKQHEERQGAK